MALRKPVIGIPEGGPHTALGELPTGDLISGADIDLSTALHNALGGKEGTGPEFIHLNTAELAAIAAHLASTSNPHAVTAAQVGALTQAAADLLYAALAHAHAAGDITSGTFADARIAGSNVTQHNGLLTHAGLNGGGSPPIAAHPPVGGAIGFVLTKASAADFDMIWAAAAAGSPIQEFVALGRSAAFAVPNAWADLTWGNVDESTNIAVVERSGALLDNIICKVVGAKYEIEYIVDASMLEQINDIASFQARVRSNDTTVLPRSFSTTNLFNDSSLDNFETHPQQLVGRCYFTPAAATDFVTLQLQLVQVGGSSLVVGLDNAKITVKRVRN